MSITVLLLAVILLLEIIFGIQSGKNLAEARVIASNAEQVSRGLEYFFNDQEKYPNPAQFNDRNLMVNYFNIFPPEEFQNKSCPNTFEYRSPDEKRYELNFCLPSKFENYPAGWNKITVSKQ